MLRTFFPFKNKKKNNNNNNKKKEKKKKRFVLEILQMIISCNRLSMA